VFPSAFLTAETLYRDLFRGYQLLTSLPAQDAEVRARLTERLDVLQMAIVRCQVDVRNEDEAQRQLELLDQQLMSCLLDLTLAVAHAAQRKRSRSGRTDRRAPTEQFAAFSV